VPLSKLKSSLGYMAATGKGKKIGKSCLSDLVLIPPTTFDEIKRLCKHYEGLVEGK
jgi:hypothetical protein